MQYDKNFKIWGVSYGLVGDLIMGLPVLNHLEKKFPGSYKIWVIEKKVGFMAPFFINHPLIDRIHITQKWNGFGPDDYKIARECDYTCIMDNWQHMPLDWYNYRDCIDETARVAGVMDMALTPLDKYPKLHRWFDTGEDKNLSTYSKENLLSSVNQKDNIISIFPFATANDNTGNNRSPSMDWWNKMVRILFEMGYETAQFGMPSDPTVFGVGPTYNHLPFFEQIKVALDTKMSIGTDSGNMWVMGAYSHPSIHLMTQWLQNHHSNKFALEPKNINGRSVFAAGGVDNISHDTVAQLVRGIME